jgi:hypothetical protein
MNSVKPIFIISNCSFSTHFVFEWLYAKAFWCVGFTLKGGLA